MNGLQPQDALLLDYCWKYRDAHGHVFAGGSKVQHELLRNGALAARTLAEVKITIGATEGQVRRLMRLSLVKPSGDEHSVLPLGSREFSEIRFATSLERVTIYYDTEAFEFTQLGLSFCKAVIAPVGVKDGELHQDDQDQRATSLCRCQRLSHRLGISGDHGEVGSGGLIGLARALLPVAERAQGNLETGREFLLRQTERTSDQLGTRRMLHARQLRCRTGLGIRIGKSSGHHTRLAHRSHRARIKFRLGGSA